MNKIGLVLFQPDNLRLNDNHVLIKAHSENTNVIHLFIYDFKIFGVNNKLYKYNDLSLLDYPKTSIFRSKFIIECVENLQQNLKKLNSDLIVKYGNPSTILKDICEKYKINNVYTNQGKAIFEKNSLKNIKNKLNSNINFNIVWENTLVPINRLPFDINTTFPNTATSFRKKLENNCNIKFPEKIPKIKKQPINVEIKSDIVNLDILGFMDKEILKNKQLPIGGEDSALNRINDYFWDKKLLHNYFDTRNELMGENFSSKLAHYLSSGCISPRYIVHEVLKYEKTVYKNKSTYWLIFELYFREYFIYYSEYYGSKMFQKYAVKSHSNYDWSSDLKLFKLWCNGETRNPLIDAFMIEMKNTGYISNRGRQIVASYLTKDLNIDWRLGALYFQSMLIDYDPALNWGNWNYSAGVGSDPRENRYFSIPKQAEKFDPKFKFIRHWLPKFKYHNDAYIKKLLRKGTRTNKIKSKNKITNYYKKF